MNPPDYWMLFTGKSNRVCEALNLSRSGRTLFRPKGGAMPVYLVERELPGIKMEQLAAAQKAAIETGQRMTKQGKNVRYIRTAFIPGESRCMCMFEASNPELVKELNESAKIPFKRIVEAMDLTP
jgi:uncharacterized protein DUF4242